MVGKNAREVQMQTGIFAFHTLNQKQQHLPSQEPTEARTAEEQDENKQEETTTIIVMKIKTIAKVMRDRKRKKENRDLNTLENTPLLSPPLILTQKINHQD